MAEDTARLEPLLDGESKEFLAFLSEIENGNPRAVAIVSGAHVEDALQAAIGANFRKLNSDERNKIFKGPTASLGTFSSKIQIGFALSIYSRSVRCDLKTIKAIRNIFAHQLSVLTFDDPKIATQCALLKYPGRKAKIGKTPEEIDPLDRFQSTAKMLFLGLAFAASKSPLANHLLHHPEHPD